MLRNLSGNSQFTGFWGSGGLREISRPPGAQSGPKTPDSGFSRSWGPFWAKHPSTRFVCMPCLASHLSPGPRYRRSCGAWGPFSSVGDRFCLLGTQPTKNGFGRNSKPPGSFREVFGSSEPRRVTQLSYSDSVGWFYPIFSRDSRCTGFWGSGGLREISRPETPKSGFSRSSRRNAR